MSLAIKTWTIALALALSTGASRSAELGPSAAAARLPEPSGGARDPGSSAEAGRASACADGEALLDDYRRLYQGADTDARAFNFLVALVPDPEESGHTDYFDSVLEGIEDAAAAGSSSWWKDAAAPLRRYVRDRHWFPWPGKDAEKRNRRCWESEPGVLIYRPLDEPQREPALAVLLVGETPTWGIRERQLFTAFDWIDARRVRKQLSMSRSQPRTHHYRILGPTFSGSADSLAAAIRRRGSANAALLGSPELSFRIASGTALAHGVPGVLLAESGQPKVEVTYQSATASSVALVEAVRRFVGDGGGRIAVLHEAATRYGESVGEPSARDDQCAPLALGARAEPGLLLYSFPPNLASIRRAYTDLGAQATPAGNRAPSEARAAPEELQGELSEQTPITHDLALAELLRDFERCEVRNVGLVATDARDVIFMAERIKRQLPDVRLFTLGMDLRYLHPEHAEALNGMLVGHVVQVGRLDRDSTVLQVPMTRNVSAAGRALLTGTEPSYEVRVSLIGNGRLWEMAEHAAPVPPVPAPASGSELVATATNYLRPLDVTRRGLRPGTDWVPPPGFVLVLVVSCLIYAAALRVLLGRRRPLEGLLGSGAQRPPSDAVAFEYRDVAADDAFASAALVSVLAGAPVLLLAAWHCRAGGLQFLSYAAVLELPALAYWVDALRRWQWASRSAIVTSVLSGLLAVACASIGCGTTREATFFLLSGSSPLIGGLVGLFLLLVAVWCWRSRLSYLQGLRFGAPRASVSFYDDGQPVARALGVKQGSELEIGEQRLLWVLRQPWRYVPRSLCLGMAVLVLLLFTKTSPLTFEHAGHHWFLVGFSIACFVPSAFSSMRIVVTAGAIRRVLGYVETSRVMPALRRLPDTLARPLHAQLVLTDTSALELKAAVAALRALSKQGVVPADARQRCEQLLTEELAYEAGQVQSPYHPRLGRAAGRLSRLLLGIAATLDDALPPSDLRGQPLDEASIKKVELANDFRAALVAVFVARYLRQIALAAPPVLTGTLSLVLITTLYFVQPQRLITTVAFVWFFAVGISLAAAYLALAQDPVLRAIGRTTESGALAWGTLARAATVIVVPLLGMLAAQYPELPLRINAALGLFTHLVH